MNNPPAFPTPVIVPEGQFTTIVTLRDYFAAAALQALVSSETFMGNYSEMAYAHADAMMKEREKSV